MHIEYKEKNQKEEIHSIILPEDIIKEDEEVSEAVEEEDLAEEEDLLYVIIVIILDTWCKTSQIPTRHVLIAEH
jgi:hypothetical protein